MQPNDITLDVDYSNDGNTTAETYDRYEEYQNRSTYIGANHAPEARDQIQMYRSFPTKSGNFKGVSKSSVKLTRDVSVTGVDGVATLTSPIITEISFSIPVGTPAADVLKARQRALAMIDSDDIMDPLNIQLMV
jgi:hypothetical protein